MKTTEFIEKLNWKSDSMRITFAFGTESIRVKWSPTCKYLDVKEKLTDWLTYEFNRLKENGQENSLRAEVKPYSTAICFRGNDKKLQEVIEFPMFMSV